MKYIYETKRLGFRFWKKEDLEACFELAKDEHVGPPCGWMPHQSIENSAWVLENVLMNDHTYCIVLKETNTIIGNMGIDMAHDSEGFEAKEDEREIGYWLGYPYWNHGYMTEAISGTLKYCFEEMNLSKVWCANFEDNPASGIVQEKNGFQYVYSKKIFWDPIQKEVNLIVRNIKNPKSNK